MNAFVDKLRQLSQKQLMLLALELNERLERAQGEAIAIVGMACRYPGGVNSPEEYWNLLNEGRDATGETPAGRWDVDAYFDPDPNAPGKISTRRGGFLDDIAGFDAGLFGISPREALSMDPQQRLLLETAWEALERAGIAPERLAGTDAGVFVGLCNNDHFLRLAGSRSQILDTYLATGNAPSVAAGRISYCLGLSGPALTVDTACSSSLVAIHLACRSLRARETSLALAGGVNVICGPETFIALSRGGMLSPDGRCKSFDAAADGFARGEGCGLLVLKRLETARADNDPILAIIRGTAINQDGRSGGLTAPSRSAQKAVIGAALADAGLEPSDIDYVEAHGTGTSLGDPIEIGALADAYGLKRVAPLLVGSAKSNIGHLESAAGVAGVMKTVLALRAQTLPPSLHFNRPSPHIPWDEIPVEVVAKSLAWPARDVPRRAGVSSFGFSGTNAHIILEEGSAAQAVESRPGFGQEDRPRHVIALSAQCEPALARLGAAYADKLRGGSVTVADVAHTAGVARSHLPERAAVVAQSGAEAAAALDALGTGASHIALFRGAAVPGRPRQIAFLFSGQGGQHPGMARALYRQAPVFRTEIDRCAEILGADEQGRTLLDVMLASSPDDDAIHDTSWTQPALFSLQHALVTLWGSWGVRPAAVIGHSLGEYAGACAAGVFSLEEGLKLVAARGRLCRALPAGAMAAVFAPLRDVEELIAPRCDRLAIAAINGPDNIVISGECSAVDEVVEAFATRGVRAQALKIAMAAHSPLVSSALDALQYEAGRIVARPPRIPVAWNLTGAAALAGDGAPDSGYWRKHLREPVRFSDGLSALYKDGFDAFLEIGPHPTLTALAKAVLPEDTLIAHSLRRDGEDWAEMLEALARLYVAGAAVDWAGVDAPYPRSKVSLPTYQFERRRYWMDLPDRERAMPLAASGSLAGTRIDMPGTQREVRLAPDAPSYLRDHVVEGHVIVPGPVMIEMVCACAAAETGMRPSTVENFTITAPLVIPEEGATARVTLDDGAFTLHARSDDGGWTRCAFGRLGSAPLSDPGAIDLDAVKRRLNPVIACTAHYESLVALGVVLGPAFRKMQQAWRGEGEALVEIAAESGAAESVDPTALDGALQAIGLAASSRELRLLTAIERVTLRGSSPSRFYAHAILRKNDEAGADRLADVTLYGDDGVEIGAFLGVCLRRASAPNLDNLCYRVEWIESPVAALSLRSPSSCAAAVQVRFTALAETCNLAHHDALLPELDRLALLHTAEALRGLHFDDTPGRRFDLDSEWRMLRVGERHARLFARLFGILADEGICSVDGATVEMRQRLPRGSAGALYPELMKRFDPATGELRLLRRCGGALVQALRGEIDPAALLFPDGSFDDVRRLYDDAPAAKVYNGALAEALRLALESAPPNSRVRVLEIGAGTGATTAHICAALPQGRFDYTFTDVSPLFLERAADRFRGVDGMRFALLDIERDPTPQGFPANSFDVVIAANALHATKDLRESVRNARDLLAPGGWLGLSEGVADERWVELTFGLTEGWHRYEDVALRPNSPLIGRKAWRSLLADEGFADIELWPSEPADGRVALKQAVIVARATARKSSWRIVAPEGDPLAKAVSVALTSRGHRVASEPDERANLIYLSAASLAHRERNDISAAPLAAEFAVAGAIDVLAKFARGGDGKAFLVTRGAQPVGGTQAPGARWQAPLWGVGRVFALEHPLRWGALIDLSPDQDEDAVAANLVGSLEAAGEEDQVALRGSSRFCARIERAAAPNATVNIRPDATYLITGGFGELGLLVGQWLASRGARHVALMGRTPRPEHPGVRAIERLGASVHALSCDVGDEGAVVAALAALRQSAPPLAGIVHAAADLTNVPIAALKRSEIAAMLRPKMFGTVALEHATSSVDLDFVALFSSTTALLGAAGFAHYAAANAFLDATAATAGTGSRVVSINWGTWGAMRQVSAAQRDDYREAGLEPMVPDDALKLMGRALQDARNVVFADIDWTRLKPVHEARRARPFLSAMGTTSTPDTPAAAEATRLLDDLRGLSVEQRQHMLIQFVRGEVAAVLGTPSESEIPIDMGLFEMGMDSLMSVEIKRRLERGSGLSLPSTLAFNYPNVRALAAFLFAMFAREDGAQAHPAPASTAESTLADTSDDEVTRRLRALIDATNGPGANG